MASEMSVNGSSSPTAPTPENATFSNPATAQAVSEGKPDDKLAAAQQEVVEVRDAFKVGRKLDSRKFFSVGQPSSPEPGYRSSTRLFSRKHTFAQFSLLLWFRHRWILDTRRVRSSRSDSYLQFSALHQTPTTTLLLGCKLSEAADVLLGCKLTRSSLSQDGSDDSLHTSDLLRKALSAPSRTVLSRRRPRTETCSGSLASAHLATFSEEKRSTASN